jgi:dimeric dUTPase (all-alpha-NTP-PPase superfamily)
MNVSHIKEQSIKDILEKADTPDMLKAIFQYQGNVKNRFAEVERKQGIHHPDKVNINSVADQDYLRITGMRVIQELCEALECLRNKPWKTSHVITDEEHMKEEMADAFHFFIELCISIGMDAEELFTYYAKKNEVNHWRINTKY